MIKVIMKKLRVRFEYVPDNVELAFMEQFLGSEAFVEGNDAVFDVTGGDDREVMIYARLLVIFTDCEYFLIESAEAVNRSK
jgi:hypothetical protein